MELNKLDPLVSVLEEIYEIDNNWDLLRNNPKKWHETIFLVLIKGRPKDTHVTNLIKIITEKNYILKSPNLPMDGNIIFLPEDPMKLGDRLFLLDKDKNYICGNKPDESKNTLRKIKHHQKTLGFLGLNVPDISKYHHPLSIDYAKTQENAFICICFGLFVISILLSFLISRRLLKPIDQLTKGTKSIRTFQFDHKIDIYSDDELGQLAKDFNQMAQTLKAYEKMRKQWLADISHELRTPITIMRSKIEAIVDGIRECSTENIVSLKSDVIRLSKLIDDLHMLSQAESQNIYIQKEALNPNVPLIETLDSFQTNLKRNQTTQRIDLSSLDNVIMEGDKFYLIRLFSNLIENSLKYTNSPGELSIQTSIHKNKLQIDIEDSSPGVPDEALNRLFDRLYRVDQSRNRKNGSSGLGLSICKEIVNMHNGNIIANHSKLGGLHIQVEFPIKGDKSET
ncbi:MAG: two-component system, OmpR family, sensor histidine kinase BaeS [Candidatus Magnetoglobus multicellularis str. Araruama]|uniref:histidine kinase n=1 Tax=Candidatus Magnetoglobus multicellularis str. Araruama TaxID=890399 RepID=A0A1V1NVE6_9BACT|nr:MAG: two-component system, OmpR family, sensor histidine kinase BaeS [Candidatus Magnetoglobus multicellularis str. Araruama]